MKLLKARRVVMKLTFKKQHCESGSVTGNGIDWWWSGRDVSGDMDAVEEIGRSCDAALREKWGKCLNENQIEDLPFTAEIEWDGDNVGDVAEVALNFEFKFEALQSPEETLAEIQEFFTTPVVLGELLRVGENTAHIGGMTGLSGGKFMVRVESSL